ncbi:MAG: DMT family transporter [Methylobacteriaceae bacterium]|nr:DMT family transporter [Methylobacteriaceae bacterium]
MPPPPRKRPVDWGALALLSLLWGGTFIFAKLALTQIAPLTLALARVALAAAILLLVLRIRKIALPRGGAWPALAGMGLINNALPFGLIFLGQSLMPASLAASLAAILNATTPLFTVLVAHALTKDEKLTGQKLAGAAIGFAGVAAMLAPRLAAGGADAEAPQLLAGMACCLTAACVYAFAGVYGRRFARMGVQPLQVAFGQSATAALWLIPVVALLERPWTAPTPGATAILATLALAGVSTALAYLLYFRLLARVGATNLMLVTFLIPVSAIALGVGLFGERLGAEHLIGMAGVALGLALIDGRAAALFSARRRAA